MRLLTQTRDGLFGVWDLERFGERPLAQVQTDAYGFCRGAIAQPGCAVELAAPVGEKEAPVALWDIERSGAKSIGKVLNRNGEAGSGMLMDCHYLPLQSLSSSSSSSSLVESSLYLILGFEDGKVSVWDRRGDAWLVKGAVMHRVAAGVGAGREGGMLTRLAVGAGGRRGVAVGTQEVALFEVDVAKGAVEEKARARRGGGLSDVACRADERLLVTGGWDHRARVFTMDDKLRPLAVLEYHTDAVQAVQCSPYHKSVFATASADSRVAIWSLYP